MKNIPLTLLLLLALGISSIGYAMVGSRGSDGSRNGQVNEFFYFEIDHVNENGIYERLLIEGVFRLQNDGELSVSWMWIFSDNGIELIQLHDLGSNNKFFECIAYQIGANQRVMDVNAVGYLRGEHLPIPECVVVFTAQNPAVSGGWKWNGDFVGNETDGSGSGSGDCEEPASAPGDERYVIRISDTEVLVIIISNGKVTVLIYRKGVDGCWRFDSAPADTNDPNLPSYTVGQTLPLVLTEYLMQLVNGQIDNAPPFPFP